MISHLISPKREEIGPENASAPVRAAEYFDLLTFPEAFVPADALVEALSVIAEAGPTGCVHVGLRPTEDASRHLFTTAELENLVTRVEALAGGNASDIAAFRGWLSRQAKNRSFNIGCVFAVDAQGQLRVSFHPKIVRSKFEVSPLPEHHMTEANLLTLITLQPTNKNYFSVTLQPIICSDALDLQRDRPGGGPLEAVNTYASCLSSRPPDHVDIVSVATCTPQPEIRPAERPPYRDWHSQFQETFENAAKKPALARHHFAAIVLSNFRNLPGKTPGGLSGVFLPVAPRHKFFHATVVIACYGRPTEDHSNNRWSQPADSALTRWSNLGFVASLDPFADPADAPARIFGFTIHRLPRDNSFWDTPASITLCEVTVARKRSSAGLEFTKDSSHA